MGSGVECCIETGGHTTARLLVFSCTSHLIVICYDCFTMIDLEKMQEEVLAFRKARDWEKYHKPKDCAISLVLEAAEVAELFQWEQDAHSDEFATKKKKKLGDELADVLYWILLISHDFGINLQEAWSQKMIENEIKYPVEKARGNAKKYTEL